MMNTRLMSRVRRRVPRRHTGNEAETCESSRVLYQFVDCRWSLDDPTWGRRQYAAGHIPGASFLDVEQDLSGPPGAAGRHPLPTADRFARAAGAAGIGPGIVVIAYGTMGGAERLWWLLRHFGHGDCAVIDLEAWRGPLERSDVRTLPTRFEAVERGDDTVTLEELRDRRDGLVLVDARQPERFRGEPNPIDKVPGRIPGAVNAPWNDPLPELPDGDVVAYCGSGVTATVVLHRLHLAGREGRLYPGSWSEWEQHDELPRATG
jgi:thiosulfate/3-mercaptopyruvate sulfurtransferase